MIRRNYWLWTAVSGMVGVLAFSACRPQLKPTTTVTVTRIVLGTAVAKTILVEATAKPEETATPEPEPELPKDLIVCTTQEPITLYPYGRTLPVETAVLHALFENDYITPSFDIQPQGLVAIPSLANDDATLRPIAVQTGDTIVNAKGEIAALTEGMMIITTAGKTVTFDDAPVMMNQLVVDFTMKQRIWADGEPVTAADSIFSFKLDADPDTPTAKYVTARTAKYEATGDLSVRWTGLPGFWDTDYAIRFWQPLPHHLWNHYKVADLQTEPVSSRQPMGDGPFVVAEWVSSDHIRLEPNPHYYRSDEGLPYLDSVTFRFLSDSSAVMDALLSGQCDILLPEDLDMSEASLLLAAEANGLVQTYFQTGTVYEHIDFGINSWDRYGDGRGRPDWFEDARVRQAMTLCTNRQGMIDEILYGRSQIVHSFIPRSHPLYPDDLVEWPYDPQAANSLLNDVGYLDSDGDGIREDPATGLPFHVTLGTSANEVEQKIARYFQTNMLDCGIEVEPYSLPAEEWYADGPDNPLFGRHFDLGEFAWIAEQEPACYFYASWEITGPESEPNPATGQPYGGWNATNETGWWDPDYDTACETARQSLPGTPAYDKNYQQAQQIFAQNLPAIPLFLRLKIAATQPNIANFKIRQTQPSSLWNFYEIDKHQ